MHTFPNLPSGQDGTLGNCLADRTIKKTAGVILVCTCRDCLGVPCSVYIGGIGNVFKSVNNKKFIRQPDHPARAEKTLDLFIIENTVKYRIYW